MPWILIDTGKKNKVFPHKIPDRLWEVSVADLLKINNSNFLCVVDHHSKLPIVK